MRTLIVVGVMLALVAAVVAPVVGEAYVAIVKVSAALAQH